MAGGAVLLVDVPAARHVDRPARHLERTLVAERGREPLVQRLDLEQRPLGGDGDGQAVEDVARGRGAIAGEPSGDELRVAEEVTRLLELGGGDQPAALVDGLPVFLDRDGDDVRDAPRRVLLRAGEAGTLSGGRDW